MFDWLIHGDLPPAGAPVDLSQTQAELAFPGYVNHFVNSGTAALALAMLLAKANRPEVTKPEVVLPAYGCPDLLSAAQFAGVNPILVDISSDDPGYSIEALTSTITPNTVAVVAVNFLGIRERLAQIRSVLDHHSDVLLIEDNAQWFPEPMEAPELHGDLVCLSFGRGKPVSLLGGGALLIREGRFELPAGVVQAALPASKLRMKAQLFNALLHKRLYWLVNRNPLLALGETSFKPLQQICTMDSLRSQAVVGNVQRYVRQTRDNELRWIDTLQEFGEMLAPVAVEPIRYGRMLRLPLLCRDVALRERIWKALHASGLGASRMYQRALPDISGVPEVFGLRGRYPQAESFAGRLLTLPVHAQVDRNAIDRATHVIASLL